MKDMSRTRFDPPEDPEGLAGENTRQPDELDNATGTTHNYNESLIAAQRARRYLWAIIYREGDSVVFGDVPDATLSEMIEYMETVVGLDLAKATWAAAYQDEHDTTVTRSNMKGASLVEVAIDHLKYLTKM